MNIGRFWRDEDGAVTVDWVVVTAMVILLATLTVQAFKLITVEFGNDMATHMRDTDL